MTQFPTSFGKDDLIKCAQGELFGEGNGDGGANGEGHVIAEFDIDPSLWFFDCHFPNNPIMPGCLGLDGLWQLTGFNLGWRGWQGRGYALGVGEVKLTGMRGKVENYNERLTLAYQTAHRIREFEIELYWRRSAYLWAMQAALIGILAYLFTTGDTHTKFEDWGITTSTQPTLQSLSAALGISILAFVISWLWAGMISGAKFWQNNWERHVDILGTELGQNLYQVYPIEDFSDIDGNIEKPVGPYSVTKVNKWIVGAFIGFWFLTILLIVSSLFVEDLVRYWNISLASFCHEIALPFLVGFIGVVLITWFCYKCGRWNWLNSLRMRDFGKVVEPKPTSSTSPALIVRGK